MLGRAVLTFADDGFSLMLENFMAHHRSIHAPAIEAHCLDDKIFSTCLGLVQGSRHTCIRAQCCNASHGNLRKAAVAQNRLEAIQTYKLQARNPTLSHH